MASESAPSAIPSTAGEPLRGLRRWPDQHRYFWRNNCSYFFMSSLIMDQICRYKMINLVGDGTYGLVYLAYNQESKEKVAAKGSDHWFWIPTLFLLVHWTLYNIKIADDHDCHIQTNETMSFSLWRSSSWQVAIKTMKRKYHSWSEVMDLREVIFKWFAEWWKNWFEIFI